MDDGVGCPELNDIGYVLRIVVQRMAGVQYPLHGLWAEGRLRCLPAVLHLLVYFGGDVYVVGVESAEDKEDEWFGDLFLGLAFDAAGTRSGPGHPVKSTSSPPSSCGMGVPWAVWLLRVLT